MRKRERLTMMQHGRPSGRGSFMVVHGLEVKATAAVSM